jgi:hypothetical protein
MARSYARQARGAAEFEVGVRQKLIRLSLIASNTCEHPRNGTPHHYTLCTLYDQIGPRLQIVFALLKCKLARRALN